MRNVINISRKVGTPRKDRDNKKMASIADEYWPVPPNPVKGVGHGCCRD